MQALDEEPTFNNSTTPVAKPEPQINLKPIDDEPTFTQPQPSVAPEQAAVPRAVLERLIMGRKVSKLLKAFGEGAKEGFGDETLGLSSESIDKLRGIGLFRDPSRGVYGPLRLMNEAMIIPAAAGADAIVRAIKAGSYGVANAATEYMVSEGVVGEDKEARFRRDVVGILDAVGLLTGNTPSTVVRPRRTPMGSTFDEAVSGLPKNRAAFTETAEAVVGSPDPHVANKVERLYNERGVLPAEVFGDAAENAVVKQDLSSKTGKLPEHYGVTREPRYMDSRGQGKQYHGTSQPELQLDDYHYSTKNYYGQGFYTTDAQDIAYGYSRRGSNTTGQRNVFEVSENRPLKIYDAEAPIADDLVLKLRENSKSGDLNSVVLDALDAKPKNMRELYDEIRDLGTNYGYTADDIQELFDNLNSVLREEGYDGLKHTGGLRTNNKPHGVTIYFNPEKDLKLTRVEPTKGELTVAKGTAATGGTPPPPPPIRPDLPPADAPKPPKGSGVSQRDLAKAAADIDKHISRNESAPGTAYTLRRAREDWVDQIINLNKETRPESGRKLEAFEDPYVLGRLHSGTMARADHMLRNATFEFNTYKNNGPSLEQVLKPFAKNIVPLENFMVAARAAEIESKGFKTPFNPETLQTIGRARTDEMVKAFEQVVEFQNRVSKYAVDSGIISQKGYAEMIATNRLFVPFHTVLDHVLHPPRKGVQSMQAYNPFKELTGGDMKIVSPVETIVKNTFVMTQMAERNAVGLAIVDRLIENQLKGVTSNEIKASKAVVKYEPKAVSEWAGQYGAKVSETSPLVKEIQQLATRVGPSEIAVFRAGKMEVWDVGEDIARAYHALDRGTLGVLESALTLPATTLRAGSLLNPDFWFSFLLREPFYAALTTAKGKIDPKVFVQSIHGLVTKSDDYWNWVKGGGADVSMVALDRSRMQETLRELTNQAGLWSRTKNTILDPNAGWTAKMLALPKEAFKTAITPLQVGLELTMSTIHFAGYLKNIRRIEKENMQFARDNLSPGTAMTKVDNMAGQLVVRDGVSIEDAIKALSDTSPNKKNILEAAFAARETSVDNKVIGAKMHALNSISAFANAKVQDVNFMAKSLKENPGRFALTVGLGITGPSLLLWAVNHNDSRYKSLENWEKDQNWIILTDKWEKAGENENVALRAPDMVRIVNGQVYVNNGTIFRYPKPFSLGVVFGSIPERMMEAALEQNGPRAMNGWIKAILQSTVGDMVPNALVPSMEQMMNHKLFNGSTVVPQRMEGQLPEYQYHQSTTETAKALGKLFSAFPGIKQERLDDSSYFIGGAARTLSSPIQLENYWRSWTGTGGMYALKLLDLGLRKAGAVPDPVKPERKDWSLDDIPIVQAFVIRYPKATTQNIQNFFDHYEVNKKYLTTLQAKMQEGDLEAMERIQKMGGEDIFLKLDGIKQSLTTQYAIIRQINQLTAKGGIEKYEARQLIDSAYYGIIKTGDIGMEVIRQIEQARTPPK